MDEGLDTVGSENRPVIEFGYTMEKFMYGFAFLIAVPSFIYTLVRLIRTTRRDLVLAARLFSYKISLTVADSIILFIYAPTQLVWIQSFWWYGGDTACRMFKFITTFGFHLTANMQVLVAADRLFITAKINKVNRNVQKRKYNTRLSLIVAWSLALICALPQLFTFAVTNNLPGGHSQCMSVWNIKRLDVIDTAEKIDYYEYVMSLVAVNSSAVFYPNMTLKIEIPEKPKMKLEEIIKMGHKWNVLEQIYNVIHLATICVIPYFIELICYTSILYILKGATKGRFMSLKDVFRDKFCSCLFTSTTRRNNSSNYASITSQVEETQSLVTIAMGSRAEGEAETRSCKLYQDADNDNRKRAASVDAAKLNSTVSSRPELSYISNNSARDDEPKPPRGNIFSCFGHTNKCDIRPTMCISKENSEVQPPASGHVRRRSEPVEAKVNTVWQSTVNTARRNARWKAFVMLSMNLLFWTPYCVIAIVSAVTVFEGYAAFQLVSALVVFNAISNILL